MRVRVGLGVWIVGDPDQHDANRAALACRLPPRSRRCRVTLPEEPGAEPRRRCGPSASSGDAQGCRRRPPREWRRCRGRHRRASSSGAVALTRGTDQVVEVRRSRFEHPRSVAKEHSEDLVAARHRIGVRVRGAAWPSVTRASRQAFSVQRSWSGRSEAEVAHLDDGLAAGLASRAFGDQEDADGLDRTVVGLACPGRPRGQPERLDGVEGVGLSTTRRVAVGPIDFENLDTARRKKRARPAHRTGASRRLEIARSSRASPRADLKPARDVSKLLDRAGPERIERAPRGHRGAYRRHRSHPAQLLRWSLPSLPFLKCSRDGTAVLDRSEGGPTCSSKPTITLFWDGTAVFVWPGSCQAIEAMRK